MQSLTTFETVQANLKIVSVARELNIEPKECLNFLYKSVMMQFESIKNELDFFVDNEIQKQGISQERHELLKVFRSELRSILWQKKLIKMLDGEYKIFMEFKAQYKPNALFGAEASLVNFMQKSRNDKNKNNIIIAIVSEFNKTTDASYEGSGSQKLMNVIQAINEEFSNYMYLAWEALVIEIRGKKLSKFPCVNEILQMLDKHNTTSLVEDIRFLKAMGVFTEL